MHNRVRIALVSEMGRLRFEEGEKGSKKEASGTLRTWRYAEKTAWRPI